jgi:hypothetical protein
MKRRRGPTLVPLSFRLVEGQGGDFDFRSPLPRNARHFVIIQSKEHGGRMDFQRANPPGREHQERTEEARRLRRLQVMMSMVMSVIGQDPDLTLDQAAEMAASARRAALAMFPGKELAYDMIYRPRLQRLINERFRLQ